jgi:hypothetical protein
MFPNFLVDFARQLWNGSILAGQGPPLPTIFLKEC